MVAYFSMEIGIDRAEWDVEAHLEALPTRVTVTLNGRPVLVRAWRRRVAGLGGAVVPVYFLDTDVEQNTAEDHALSHFLYGGDAAYRLAQEAVLGIGGVRMLRARGASAPTGSADGLTTAPGPQHLGMEGHRGEERWQSQSRPRR